MRVQGVQLKEKYVGSQNLSNTLMALQTQKDDTKQVY